MRAQEFIKENMDHDQDGRAVTELKTALLAKKDQLQSATDDQVYDIIDKIMTRIARSHSISGQKLHDMWVDRYKQIPDTWIMNENFADGKVKGKSRPGRVKRSGASCAGSVTDLRAKAKKYGGEKGKMYHWCANMKSGKKNEDLNELKINNQSGVGAVPYNAEIDYHGVQVAMKPSVFLSLALPLNARDPEERKAIEYCKSQKDQTGFGAPFLTIQVPEEWETGNFDQDAKVKGHDGRHRCYAILETEGDHAIETHLILNGFRRRHITDDMINHLREGMINQQGKYTTGPLFGEAN